MQSAIKGIAQAHFAPVRIGVRGPAGRDHKDGGKKLFINVLNGNFSGPTLRLSFCMPKEFPFSAVGQRKRKGQSLLPAVSFMP